MISKRNVFIYVAFLMLILLSTTASAVQETVDYIYDKGGRLIRVQYGDGTTVTQVIDYFYDDVGNRVRKAVGLSEISVSPASFDFSFVTAGTTSNPATFTVSNNGNIDLEIGQIGITGPEGAVFAVQNDTCSGQPIAHSGGSCTVEALFSPVSGGLKNANLSIPSDDPNAPTVTSQLSGTSDGTYQLDVMKGGSGTGTVTAAPLGIDCGADCSEVYMPGLIVTLTAVPDTNFQFTGWTSCDNDLGGGVCEMTMDADKTVTANFGLALVRVAKLDSSYEYFSTLQDAYNAAADGETIQSQAVTLTGGLILDISKSIIFEGGYDADFTNVIGDTTIIGNVDVINGYVDMGNFVIQ